MGKFCGKCGTKLDETTGLCPKCNSKALEQPEPAGRKGVGIVVLGVLLLSAAVLWLMQNKEPETAAVAVATEAETVATTKLSEIVREETIQVETETKQAEVAPEEIESVAVEETDIENVVLDSEKSTKETDFIKREQILWTYLEGVNQSDTFEVLRIVVDEKPLDIKMQGFEQKKCNSLKGDVWCILSADNILYLIDGGVATEVAKNVTDCVLSGNGEGLVYTDERDTLILYSVATGTKKEIAQNVDKVIGFVVSPDGKAVAYAAPDDSTGNSNDDSESLAMYVFLNGKTTRFGINQIPAGISNGGSQIYYVMAPEKDLYGPCSLYVGDMHGSSRLLAESQMMLGTLYFNEDQTQLLFISDENFYLSVNGGEAVVLASDRFPSMALNLVIPESSAYIKSWNRFGGTLTYYIYPINNFARRFYTEFPTHRLFYLDQNFELKELGNGQETRSVRLSDDTNMLMYSLRTDMGFDLYRVKNVNTLETEQLAENIWYGVPSLDWKAVYYIDQNDTLWYKREHEDPRQIADHVDFCSMTHDGYALFGTFGSAHGENERGKLYSSKDGGEIQLLISDFFDSLYTYPTVTLAYTNYDKKSDTHDIYAATDGVDFVKIVEGAKYDMYSHY